jgi:hypothetical protein
MGLIESLIELIQVDNRVEDIVKEMSRKKTSAEKKVLLKEELDSLMKTRVPLFKYNCRDRMLKELIMSKVSIDLETPGD